MSAFFSDPAVGGNGTTTTDDRDPVTGLDAGGWKTRFIPALAQAVAIGNWVRLRALDMIGYVQEAKEVAQDAEGSAATAFDFSVIADEEADRAFGEAERAKGEYVRAKAEADRAEQLAGSVDPKEIVDIVGLPEALDAKAPLNSPALTGAPTAPTPAADAASERIVTMGALARELGTAAHGQPVLVTANRAAVNGATHVLLGDFTVTLPANPAAGVEFGFSLSPGTTTGAAKVNPNGKKIANDSTVMTINISAGTFRLKFTGDTYGYAFV